MAGPNAPYSGLDSETALRQSFSASNDALRTTAAGGVLVPEKFDFVAATYPDTVTEVYTYKNGGASGTLIATVTLVYTNSTKANLSTVTRT
jgi:hypothetical protein